MADDKTTKMSEQPVTDTGPGKETPPAPPKEPEKVSVSPEPEKKTEPEVKNPQVSVYNFAEIMKEKKAEERAAAPGVEKPDPAKVEKPEKQPETPKRLRENRKSPKSRNRRSAGAVPRKQIRTRTQPRSPKLPHRNRKRRSKRNRRKKRLQRCRPLHSEGTRKAEGCTTPGQGANRLYQAERAPRLQKPSL